MTVLLTSLATSLMASVNGTQDTMMIAARTFIAMIWYSEHNSGSHFKN